MIEEPEDVDMEISSYSLTGETTPGPDPKQRALEDRLRWSPRRMVDVYDAQGRL